MFLGAFNFIYHVKISLHLDENGIQNVPAALLIRFLREHRSEWADCDIDASAAAAFRSTTRNGTAGHSQLSLPLVNSSEQEEVLPLVKTFRFWQFTWNHSNKTSLLISCKCLATSSWCKYFPRHSGAFPKNIWLPVPKR
jgi:hypothetical protein